MPAAPANNAAAQYATARALWEQGDVVRCEAILRGLTAHAALHEDAAWLLAELLRSQGRLNAAADFLSELCRNRDFAVATVLRAASFLAQCQRQTVADTLCDAALAHHGGSAELFAVAGNIAREIGDFDKARARYLAALDARIDLNVWYVLGALAHTRRYNDADRREDMPRFTAHFHNVAYSPRARAATGFGMAKVDDDLGDRRAAAQTLRSANALVRSVVPWSTPQWQAFVAARVRERIARPRAAPRDGFVPVFVLGLPRTGTTLSATRLAAHPQAHDRGELRMLRFIAEQLIAGDHLRDPAALDEAAALYYAHARQDDAPATWYIDQDPLNFRYVNLIEALFPQARIVHCVRDRRDTALSLWSQDFAHADSAFAYDFTSIAEYAAGHDTLMAHWRRTLSLPIHELHYEQLIADPAATLAALRRFVGMPQADAGAASAAAPINTSSVWQARQPIYATSVGRWKGYAPYLPELEQLFG